MPKQPISQSEYFLEAKMITARLHEQRGTLDKMVEMLRNLKVGKGRLFILGVGGSAANASHAVNDFRKIAGIEAYTPTDNVALLTAVTNDSYWSETFNSYLVQSKVGKDDVVMILSVGGGSFDVSKNIVYALDSAYGRGAKIIGIVGPGGGHTAEHAHLCIKIPAEKYITPMVESFQAIIWHYLVNSI